jgi:Fe-S-cluster containining protein
MKPFAEQKGRVYTEDDWLPQTEEDCEKAEKDEKYVLLMIPRRYDTDLQPNGRFPVVLRFQEVCRDCRFRDPKASRCQIHSSRYQPT